MNLIVPFSIEVVFTLIMCLLLASYLRRFLYRILLDLCGTEDRAKFWTIFTNFLMIGIPVMMALSYRPETLTAEDLFFEISNRLSVNLATYLSTLVGVGVIVSFFALVAPKPNKAESK
jgi:hypothetical protein